MKKQFHNSTIILILCIFNLHQLPVQEISPAQIMDTLQGEWKISKEQTLNIMGCCGNCDTVRFKKELRDFSKGSLEFRDSGVVYFRDGRKISIEGTYKIEAIPADARESERYNNLGKVFQMTIYGNRGPSQGDKMLIILMDGNTVSIFDVGCGYVIIRKKGKERKMGK